LDTGLDGFFLTLSPKKQPQYVQEERSEEVLKLLVLENVFEEQEEPQGRVRRRLYLRNTHQNVTKTLNIA